MRDILVQAALPFNPSDPSWVTTKGGHRYSHLYGFGRVDAWRVVMLGLYWQASGARSHGVQILKDTKVGTTKSSFTETFWVDGSQIKGLQHVTVRISVDECSYRGMLSVLVESPGGTLIPLASKRPLDVNTEGLFDWVMMTPAFWDEPASGAWKLHIRYRDDSPLDRTIRLISFQAAIWGALKEPYVDEDDHIHSILKYYYPRYV